ncbi:MAG: OB-fold domain-containing protein [Acidobacteriota bacterium]|nr:OB-fold domain-containing protein [Acidobacteriota bacterium]
MTVYTETVVHLAPEAFQKDVPYQVAIVQHDDGTRITGRIEGERVSIGDNVEEIGARDGIPWFRKSQLRPPAAAMFSSGSTGHA